MKSFKKLFAIVATAAMLLQLVNVSAVSAASFSDELQGAYDYAYGMGITTQSTIDSANMYGTLIRSHMAKMMVEYAKEAGKTADTSVEVNFTDIADQSTELQGYIEEAAQMGLMGLNADGSVATKFNPNGVVTRAQFGTVLSRVLYGDANNGSEPYYADHLEALKDAGIMNNISNPNANEIRGYVMLMMQRADEGTTPATCSTAENILACTLGTSACPAECKDDVAPEANGNLTVKMVSSNGGDVPYGISALEVAKYKLTADEDVRLDSLTLTRGGYSDDNTLDGASLFINGGRVSKIANFNSDEEAIVSITNGYTLKAGSSVEITAVVSVSDEWVSTPATFSGATVLTETGYANPSGDQFSIELSKVASTAEDVDMASDLTSDTFKILSKQNKTIAYSVQNALEDPKAGEEAAELFEFKLTNSSANDQDATLKSITFKEGTANTIDSEDLKNFQLVVDGNVIAETEGFVGKYLTFNVDGYQIKEGKAPIFTVKADVNGGAGEDISFLLDNAMDLTVIGDTYDIPMNVSGAGTESESESVNVSAGKVSIAKVNTEAGDLLRNKDNIFMGAFTIENKAGESLSLDTLDFYFGADQAVLENVEVRLGSTTASPIDLDSNWRETDLDKSIGSKLTVYVYADTKDVSVDAANLRMELEEITINETVNDEPVTDITPDTLTWSSMAGTDAGLTLTNVTLGAKTVSEGTEGIEAISFKVKASDAVAAKVKKITFTTAANVDTDTITAATLYNGTKEIATTVKLGSIVVDEDFTIAAGTTATLVLKVDTASNPDVTSVTYALAAANIEAVEANADEDDIPMGISTITGRLITIVDAGTMQSSYESTASNNKHAKNILGGSDAVVAEYSVYSKYEGINVDTATVTFSGAIQNSTLDVQLYYGDTMVASDPTWTSASVATFTDLDFDTATAKKALTVKVISKIIGEENGNVSMSDNKILSISLDGLKGVDSGEDVDGNGAGTAGTAYTVLGGSSNMFSIVPVTLTPAVTSITATKGTFTITAANGSNETTLGDEAKATLSGLVFNVTSNGGLTGLTVKNEDTGVTRSTTAIGATASIDVNSVLSNGTTTFTITPITVNSDANFTVSLSQVKYTTTVDNTTLLNASFGVAKDVLTK